MFVFLRCSKELMSQTGLAIISDNVYYDIDVVRRKLQSDLTHMVGAE